MSAAAEQDPVAGVERVFEVAVDARQHHPDAAGERQRPLEADAAVVAEVVQAQREADNRFPRPAGHADTISEGLIQTRRSSRGRLTETPTPRAA